MHILPTAFKPSKLQEEKKLKKNQNNNQTDLKHSDWALSNTKLENIKLRIVENKRCYFSFLQCSTWSNTLSTTYTFKITEVFCHLFHLETRMLTTPLANHHALMNLTDVCTYICKLFYIYIFNYFIHKHSTCKEFPSLASLWM